jgi:general secretion pathway protein H
MPLPNPPRRNYRREAGFTLLEIICALAIVALLALVALPALPSRTSRPRLEGYAMQIASVLIADRAASLRRGAAVYTLLDGKARTVASGAGGETVRLPAEIEFDATLAASCEGRAAGGAIVFLANGMSCGGAIFVGRGAVAYQIRINWLTGAVDVLAGRDNAS